GVFDFGIKNMQKLRSALVEHYQKSLLHNISARISTLPGLFRGMLAEPEADMAFPLRYSDEWGAKRDAYLTDVKEMMDKKGADSIPACFDMICDVVLEHSDLKTGARMMKTLEEKMFFWALMPAKVPHDVNMEASYGRREYGYVKMLVQLEEMALRLRHVKRRWEGISVKVFDKDDYAESVKDSESRLRRLRDEEMCSPELLERVKKGEININNILFQIASEGRKHRDMVIRYADLLIRKLRTEILGEEKEDPEDYAPQKSTLIVIEPRLFVSCGRQHFRKMGFSDDEIKDKFGIDDDGKIVRGVMSSYLMIEAPLREYDGQPLAGVKANGGTVYMAQKAQVFDFYRHEIDMPSALRRGLVLRRPMEDIEFVRALEMAELPSGFAQVSVPYDVVMQREREIAKRRMPDRDGNRKYTLDYHVTGVGDMGAHSRLTDRMSKDARCSMISSREFYSRTRRSIPPPYQ
ncbi:hypothetical protein KY359_06495, partial [Candidatus Woesearchaeota archaeon]|nr:hypothetical protein [Candidatus Woesearchaeota archaeon]